MTGPILLILAAWAPAVVPPESGRYFPEPHRWERIEPHRAGFGGNYIYIDECNDLQVVLRWVPDLPGVIGKVMEALEDPRLCA